jgi:flagellar basal body rod protein FlgG
VNAAGADAIPHERVRQPADGTIRVGQTVAGRIKVVTVENEDSLVRETGTRFRVPAGVETTDVEDARIFAGALEQSNVSVVERVAVMTDVSRSFEALQKGISVLMNDIDGRAIAELGRK